MKRLLILALLLSGCTQLPPLPPTPASQLDSWRLNGRIAVSSEHESWPPANVYWQQQGSAYELRLNMAGQGALLLKGNNNGVIMHTADKKIFKAANPDALFAEVLKLEIPVTNLHSWIRGFPAPHSSPQWYQLNETGRLRSLRQNGWEIDYKHYVNIRGIYLPKKIFLENNQFKVKIAITQWHLEPSI